MVIIMMMVHMVPYMVIKTMKINYRYIKLNPPKDAAQNVPKTSYAAIKPDLISKVEPRDHHHHCQHRLKPHQQGRQQREPWALQKDSGNRFRRSLRSPHHSHSWKCVHRNIKVPTIVITGSMFIEISASKEILENLHSQVNLKTKKPHHHSFIIVILIKIILNVLLRVIGGDGSVEENFDVVIGVSFCRSPSLEIIVVNYQHMLSLMSMIQFFLDGRRWWLLWCQHWSDFNQHIGQQWSGGKARLEENTRRLMKDNDHHQWYW